MRLRSAALLLAMTACTRRETPAPMEAAAAAVGLLDPTNAPPIVAAIREIRAQCRIMNGDYNDDCDAVRRYHALRVTKADASTLVALLEDPDPGVEMLGAYHAARHRDFFRDDAALATRMVTVSEVLPADYDAHAPELAGVLCRIEREKPRIAKLARTSASERLRAGLVSCLEDPALAEEAARSPAEDVRRAATIAAAKAPTTDDCRAWAKDLDAKRPSTIEAAVEKILSGRKQRPNPFVRGLPDANAHNACPPDTIDAALAIYPRRFKEGGLTLAWLGYLGDLGWSADATREQKAKAFAIAKEIYDASPPTYGRSALTAMAELDPGAARPIVLAHGGSTAADVVRTVVLERLEERATQPE